jgi:hypothetical protein
MTAKRAAALDTKARTKRIKIPPMTEAEVAAAAGSEPPTQEIVRIEPPRLKTGTFQIRGISPYVQHAFSEKARKLMEENQRAGQQSRGRRNRQPKDFEAVFEAAHHRDVKGGWVGIPAPAFRNASIDACRLCGIKMTHAKLSIFVEADGFDHSGMPLVRIEGEPRIHQGAVRNESGVADIRWRPMWEQWSAAVRITWDLDQYSATDVGNLLYRAGLQVGIGEGRPSSPNSNGLGWGRFEVLF